MANVLERKAWSRGKPDANSEVPQKQKEKYLHPDAAIWVVKSSGLKRIRDAVILISHRARLPYLGRGKKASKPGTLCRGYSSSTDPRGRSRGCFPRLPLPWHAPQACVCEAAGVSVAWALQLWEAAVLLPGIS